MNAFKLLLLQIFLVSICTAQTGSADLSFNAIDTGFSNPDRANNNIQALSLQPDGKMIIGGRFTLYNGVTKTRIARINSNGSIDKGFSEQASVGGDVVTVLALQPDGKIVLGGSFSTVNGVSRNSIARLNSDGTLDAAFDVGDGVNGHVISILIQPDGKIIIAGSFSLYNNEARSNIVRLNSNGSVDNSFTGAFTYSVMAMALQADGKIVVAHGNTQRISRLNADGSVDGSFGVTSGISGNIWQMALQPDGKILVTGTISSYNGTSRRGIVRINSNGTADLSFTAPFGQNDAVTGLVLQADGKIVAATVWANATGEPTMIRLNSDGTIDASYHAAALNSGVSAMQLQTDGKVLIAGDFNLLDSIAFPYLARLHNNGSPDTSINAGTGANNGVYATAIASNNKVVIGGSFTWYNGSPRHRIAILHADGTTDHSFNPGSGPDNTVNAIVVQPDQKIVIAGAFANYRGSAAGRIIRINTDGTRDISFNPGSGANGLIRCMVLQPDGKIVVGGDFTAYNGITANRIARINTDGTMDASFVTGQGFPDVVYALALLNNGSILAGGEFWSYNGTGVSSKIIMIQPNGALDNSFSSNYAVPVYAIAVQPDQKILIGGPGGMNRLNVSGAVDATFNPGYINNVVHSIALQPSGKIILAGTFTTHNSIPRYKISRMNENGTIDLNFNPGSGPTAGSNIYSIVVDQSGNTVVAGNFVSYNNVGRNRVARIQSSSVFPVEFINLKVSRKSAGVLTNWQVGGESDMQGYQVEHSIEGSTFSKVSPMIAALNTGLTNTYSWYHHDAANSTGYYRIKATGKDGSLKYSNIERYENNSQAATALQLYPNPVLSTLYLKVAAPEGYESISIYNAAGHLVLYTRTDMTQLLRSLNVESLTSGVYTIVVKGRDLLVRGSFIKR